MLRMVQLCLQNGINQSWYNGGIAILQSSISDRGVALDIFTWISLLGLISLTFGSHRITTIASKLDVGVDVLTQSSTMDGLEDKMGDLVQPQQNSRFVRLINARLRFADMPDRFERIPTTFQDTFVWLYRSPESHPEADSFLG
jgi:hypothetical protein